MMADGRSGGPDRWFDPWLVPQGGALGGLADDLQALLAAKEKRTRARKPDDQRRFTATVRAVTANLAANLLHPSKSCELAVPLANLMSPGVARYGNPLVPVKTLKATVMAMRDAGLLIVTPGYRGKTTTIRESEGMASEFASRGVLDADIAWDGAEGEELIILTRKRQEELEEGTSPRVFSERIGYADTPDTHAMRRQVQELNVWVARLDIAFEDDAQLPQIDISQRRSRRHFSLLPGDRTPRFDLGGRLFGAFWHTLSRDRRRASLRLQGEPIAEVDFNALFVRLAYGQLGAQLPSQLQADPYAIKGFPREHRAGLKKALNALLFADGELKRLPPDIIQDLPSGWSIRRLRDAILQSHPVLHQVIGSRVGFGLMFTESVILMAAMARMRDAGLCALPLHDAVLVPRSQAEEARLMLMAVGGEVSGLELPVSVKA